MDSEISLQEKKLLIERKQENIKKLFSIYSNLETINNQKGLENGINISTISKNIEIRRNSNQSQSNKSNNNLIQLENSHCSKCSNRMEIYSCFKCNTSICKMCSDFCSNRKSNHTGKRFCNDCMNLCSLCSVNKTCSECSKKCFSKSCNNLFCTICYDRNKHQVRKEDTKCKFYKCETCNNDSNCIIRTIYCANCDKRVCHKCLSKDHKGHLRFN